MASSADRMEGHGAELWQRIIVAVPALIVAVLLIDYGGLPFSALLILLGIACLHELFQMFDEVGPVRLAGFIGLVGMILAAYYGSDRSTYYLMIALCASFPLVFFFGALQVHTTALGWAVTIFGLVWIGVALGHAQLLRELPHGVAAIVTILAGVFVGDSVAYSGGKAFGRNPLAPSISPNKTIEGLILGMVGAVTAVWVAGLYQDWITGIDALILGACIAVTAPLGDLFESYIKRQVGTKDTGKLFGAHGGALDRLDAVLFAAVVGYYMWITLL
ncbi:MAG: phosphatidate cytidylyltransferase [Solirubrobacteraceae bacterium]|nr:phosphatidate cytidylyltransferase [Solirubrobacteraceae bacterium]